MSINTPRGTHEQIALRKEFVETYGLDESQISFEGESLEPIFDYEALNVLRLYLTNIEEIIPEVVERTGDLITIRATAVLPEGKCANDLGTAYYKEILYDGTRLKTYNQMQDVALSRAVRRVIRSSGVNLLKAHKTLRETGEVAAANPSVAEKKTRLLREIHALATEYGHIRGSDKERYRDFISNVFDGKRSSTELDDVQQSQLANLYKSMIRHKKTATERVKQFAA